MFYSIHTRFILTVLGIYRAMKCKDFHQQGCTNSGHQFTMATKFCTLAADVCGSSLRKFLYVSFLAHRILRCY
jgi:hypothetical protein